MVDLNKYVFICSHFILNIFLVISTERFSCIRSAAVRPLPYEGRRASIYVWSTRTEHWFGSLCSPFGWQPVMSPSQGRLTVSWQTIPPDAGCRSALAADTVRIQGPCIIPLFCGTAEMRHEFQTRIAATFSVRLVCF